MSQGEKMETDVVLVEKVAKGLYEADRDHEATWPLSDDDDGNRGDGEYVRVTPRDVVEEYRQHARDALKVVPPLLATKAPTPSPATVDVGEGASQGLCETTSTERFAFAGCKCPTYAGNLGPCREYEVAGNGRCVFCDHDASCHVRSLASALETEHGKQDLLSAEIVAMRADLDAAEALAREAGKALEFYADELLWQPLVGRGESLPSAVEQDNGRRARATLAQLRPVTTEGK